MSLFAGRKRRKKIIPVLNSIKEKTVCLSLSKEQLIAHVSACSEIKRLNYPEIKNISLYMRN